jgi:N-acetylglucosaminyl-diphospho-decaprenol L-rhamnosyltransferase
MSRVGVVIVNFNAGALLAEGIARVRQARGAAAWDVTIVDNASTDGSLDALHEASDVRVMRNTENVGFGVACNQGAGAGDAPWILFLNPDCALAPGVVEHLVAEADAQPDCVAIGPRIEDPDGTTQGSARGDPDLFAGVAGRTGLLTRLLPSSGMVARQVVWPERVPPGQASVEVDWLSGACLMVRRTAFAAIGGFDPGYFMYWEDADLCRRLRERGGRIRYAPSVHVRHAVGHSSRRAPALALRAFHASAYRYYTRWNAPHRWDPRRALARSLLTLRLWVKLARAR